MRMIGLHGAGGTWRNRSSECSMLPQSFLDDVLARTDVVDIVGRSVQLKKSGANYMGLCPFHSEKSPSFTVSATKQFYHCFGCGAHGSAITFLMEYDGMPFLEAVRQLAGSAGLPVPQPELTHDDKVRQEREQAIMTVLEAAARIFMQNLGRSAEAVKYLKSERGLVKTSVLEFGIGYADGKLVEQLREFGADVLVSAGLATQKENGDLVDKFRNRVMFPICSEKGRVIGFGGRALSDEQQPKYLNTAETLVFHKGRELFGLNVARDSIRQSRVAIVLEGYMDVVSVRQSGESRAVAALGTAVTEDQVKRLFRMADEIVFCLDGDAAGQKAAARVVPILLAAMPDGKSARFLTLPVEDDPDSFVRRAGIEAWSEMVERAMMLSRKVREMLFAEGDADTPEGQAALARQAEVLCELVVDAPRYRDALIAYLEKEIGIELRVKRVTPSKFAQAPGGRDLAGPVGATGAVVAHYEAYRRLALLCAMAPEDGADLAAAGIDPFADLLVSWFSSCQGMPMEEMRERAAGIGDVTVRGFVLWALQRIDARWAVLADGVREAEREAAATALLGELDRLRRMREASEALA